MIPSAWGVDVGGTWIRLGLVSDGGQVIAMVERPHRGASPQAVVQILRELRIEARARAGGMDAPRAGVAIAAHLQGTRVVVAPNLGWRDVDVAAAFGADFPAGVYVVNDVRAAALAELTVGAAVGANDAMMVWVGTGVGGALVVGGSLHEGHSGVAGEFGHMKVAGSQVPCGCGQQGCLEAVSGGAAIERWLRTLPISGQTVESRAKVALGGDREARQLMAPWFTPLALSIGSLVTAFNPELVVFGGGVLLGAPSLRALLEAEVSRHATNVSAVGLRFGVAGCGESAGIVGAAIRAQRG